MTQNQVRNVLITCGGGFQGLAILDGLRQIPGVRTVICDWNAENVGRFFSTAFRRSPPVANTEAYIEFVRALISTENIELVIPASDLDLEVLAASRASFEALNATVAVSDPALLAILMDKRATYRLAAEAGLNVFDEVEVEPEALIKTDLIVKPVRGSGSKGHRVLRRGEVVEGLSTFRDSDKFLVQPYIEGAREYSVDFCVNVRGEVSPLAARERIRNFSGFSVLGQSASHQNDLLKEAGLFANFLACRGALGGFNLQFIDDGGRLRLIDVNARFGTSSSFSLLMGTNLQAWLLSGSGNPVCGHVKLIKYVAQACAPVEPCIASGVVFDLDDTLIDQKAWIWSKLKLLYEKFASVLPSRSQFLTAAYYIVEEGDKSLLIDTLIERLGLPLELREKLIEVYRAIVPEDIFVYPDVERVVIELSRRGFSLGLLSDNPAESQRQKLERLRTTNDFISAFDAVVLADELGVRKPDARAFWAIASALKSPCDQLVMVGDNLLRDSIGAIEAGFAGAFLLKRQGAFFSFNRMIAKEIDEGDRTRWIDDLDQLLWHLPMPNRARRVRN